MKQGGGGGLKNFYLYIYIIETVRYMQNSNCSRRLDGQQIIHQIYLRFKKEFLSHKILSKEKIIISRILKLDILLDVYQCVIRGTEIISNINIHTRSSSKGDFYSLKMAMTIQSS